MRSTHVRTTSIPSLIKIEKTDETSLDFEESKRDKKIELDESGILRKFKSITFLFSSGR